MKPILTSIFVLLLNICVTFKAYGQVPTNDECLGATTVIPDGSCYVGTTVLANDSWSGLVGCQNPAGNHPDVWYSFTATGTQLTMTINDSTGWAGNIEFTLATGTCPLGPFIIQGSDCGPSVLNVTIGGLTTGLIYYFTISNSPTGNPGMFGFCIETADPPAGCIDNDDCLTPQNIPFTTGITTCISDCNVGSAAGPDFAGANCYDFPDPTVWYSFTTGVGNGSVDISVTSTDLMNPYYTVFQSVDCFNYIIVDCQQGSGGSVSATTLIAQGQPYLIAISDQNGDVGDFNLCITVNNDSSACNTNDVLQVTGTSMGSPFAGPFLPGEIVTFCYTITDWQQVNCNYLGGIVPEFGSCWDPVSFNAQGMPINITTPLTPAGQYEFAPPLACQGNPTGQWSWFPAGSVEYNLVPGGYVPPLTPLPAGWFFTTFYDSQGPGDCAGPAETDPDNSYGDGNYVQCNDNDLDWQICFQLQVRDTSACGLGLTDCEVLIKTYADGEIGSWDNIGCTVDQPAIYNTVMDCCIRADVANVNDDTICNGGSIAYTFTSDQDPGVTYNWTYSPGPGISGGSAGVGSSFNQTLFNSGSVVSSAMYIINADNGTCIGRDTFFVSVIPPFVVDAGPASSITCSSPTANLIGSSSALSPGYLWTNGATTASTSTTVAGTYVLTVSSFGMCPVSDSVIITNNTTPPIANGGGDQLLTCGSPTAVLDGSASSTGPTFSYAWSGPSFTSTSQSPTVSVAGTYILTVVNSSNGCSSSDTVVVNADPSLPISLAGSDQTITCVVTTVTLDGSGSSTGSQFSYSWSGPGAFSSTLMSPSGVTTPGTYTLTVSDTTGCQAFDNVIVNINTTPPNLTTGTDTTISCGNPSIPLSSSSSTGGTTFQWSSSNGNIVSGATSSTVTVNSPGTYVVTVTDGNNGCTSTDSILVSASPAVNLSVSNLSDVSCMGGNNGMIAVQTSGGSPGFTYNWSPIVFAGTSNSNLSAGNYTIVVIDQNNCSDTVFTSISQPSSSVQLLLVDTISPNCGQTNGEIEVVASGGTSPYQYTWLGYPDTTSTLSNIGSGNYTALCMDGNNCPDTMLITLGCINDAMIITTLITPNGDNKNDFWVITNLSSYPNNNVKIFNRWGNEVFNAKPYTNDWAGQVNAGLQMGTGTLPSGTYFYLVDLTGDGSEKLSGYLELQK